VGAGRAAFSGAPPLTGRWIEDLAWRDVAGRVAARPFYDGIAAAAIDELAAGLRSLFLGLVLP
jgi:hypothetical protein